MTETNTDHSANVHGNVKLYHGQWINHKTMAETMKKIDLFWESVYFHAMIRPIVHPLMINHRSDRII